jgi:outer membrane protein assembly factor BamB
METSTTSSRAAAIPRDRARHVWFPLLVLALAGSWWLRQTAAMGYTTILHVLVVIGSAGLLAIWFVRCGPGVRRMRHRIVWACLAAFFMWMVVMKPVWNGDMGIYRWKLRFADAPDQELDPISATDEAIDWQATPRDYPRFLGNGYWAEVEGVQLDHDWQTHPPELVWRHEIGAGWSGFAIVGNYAVTQEQRGDEEIVACYRVDNGELVWTHADKTRFDPADFQGGLGGIGPRSTPTIHDGKIFTQGATGIVNCLDARTGKVLWSHDTAQETGADVIIWGKSGSPLVAGDMVLVSVGAPNDETLRDDYHSSLVAYDLETGDVRWAAGNRQASYASPLVTTLAGERQIVMLNEKFLTGHRIADGTVLWEFPWASEDDSTATTTQPIPFSHDRLLLTKGYGVGSSLLKISQNAEGKFAAEPLWEPPIKRVMKTKFANPVVRDGYVYGLDDVLLSCIDVETGKVRWKKRRTPEFGHGQILLVGDVILVLSETGELALVEVSPDEYRELASIQALDSADTTWNTPAFAPPYLIVRNSREVACYRLPLIGSEASE